MVSYMLHVLEGFVLVILFCCFYNIILSIHGYLYMAVYSLLPNTCTCMLNVNNNFSTNSRVLECKSSLFVIGKSTPKKIFGQLNKNLVI